MADNSWNRWKTKLDSLLFVHASSMLNILVRLADEIFPQVIFLLLFFLFHFIPYTVINSN